MQLEVCNPKDCERAIHPTVSHLLAPDMSRTYVIRAVHPIRQARPEIRDLCALKLVAPCWRRCWRRCPASRCLTSCRRRRRPP
eukprot:4926363-Prymnesium_polylepis.1